MSIFLAYRNGTCLFGVSRKSPRRRDLWCLGLPTLRVRRAPRTERRWPRKGMCHSGTPDLHLKRLIFRIYGMDELRKTELQARIMLRITRYQRRVLIAKTAGFGALCAASISLIVFGSIDLVSGLAQSGFFQFASLFISDFSSAAANFQDFAFSLLESFPIFSSRAGLAAAGSGIVRMVLRAPRQRTFTACRR